MVFGYRGTEFELVDRQVVEIVPPPADRPADRPETGFWYELRDAEERTLYRRVTQNPMPFSVEVLTDDRDRPIARERLGEREGQFVLFAPDIPDATSVVLFASPEEPEAFGAPAQELGRVDLGEASGPAR